MAWELIFYQSGRGECQVLEFLRGLEKKARQEAGATLADLEESRHRLGRPDSAPLRDGIYELRIVSNRNEYRILFFFAGKRIVLTNAFAKKTQRVPIAEIERAIRRRAEWMRGRDGR